MSERIIVVTGFPRSGTSLLMQMLAAAGVRCLGEWPAFEDDATNPRYSEVSRDVIESMRGGALKLLEPQLIELPKGFLYDFVWTRRNRWQQACSQLKLLRALGVPVKANTAAITRVARSMEKDEPRAIRALQSHAGHRWITTSFEQLILTPDSATSELAHPLKLPAAPMRACIRPRTTACLTGLLELQQLAEAESSAETAAATI